MRSAFRNLTVSGDDGAVDREEVAHREEVRRVGVEGRPLLLLRREATAVVVVDGHVEAPRPPGEGLADPAHAEDPEALAGHVGAEHEQGVPAVPGAAPHEAVPLRAAAGGREDAQHRGVGGRVGEDVRGVRDHDPDVAGGGDVDVLVPDRVGRDDAERARHLLQHLAAEPLRRAAHHRVVLAACGDELFGRVDPVGLVQRGTVPALKTCFDVGRKLARRQHLRPLSPFMDVLHPRFLPSIGAGRPRS